MNSATKPTSRRGLKRRLAAGSVAVAATAALGLGATAAPASAMPNNPCANARAHFRAMMNEARFWIGAADSLAAGGYDASSAAASNEAGFYLGQASDALDAMSSAC